MSKKILLISANRFKVPYPVYPLGVAYIHTYLKKNLPDFDIRVFDMNLASPFELQEYIAGFQPGYIGISLRNADDVDSTSRESFTGGYRELVEVSRKNGNAVVIIGGSAFSIFPELFYRELSPDYGIIGEGEESMYKLISSLEKGIDVSSIEGLVLNDGNGVRINPRRKYIHSLELNFDPELLGYYWHHSGMLNIQTKRGCPFRCVYCTYPLIEGRHVRTLDPGQIVETLERLKKESNIDYVFFTDSVFNISKRFNTELAELLIRRDLRIRWGAYFTITHLERDFLALMKKAGLTHIEFGTESLSDITLKSYGKEFTAEEVIRASDWCNELDIYFAHFLILGGIGETEESLAETFENSKRINNSVFFPFVGMRIYPGTPLHESAINEGLMSREEELLEPRYYIASGVHLEDLKQRAAQTGKRWVFPDEDHEKVMEKMRLKNKKGPLWEYLIR